MSDDSGDLLAAGVNDALDALLDGRENYIGGENELVPFPQRRPGRKWRRTRIGGRYGTPPSSIPRRQVSRDATSARIRTLEFRFLLSANSFLDQAVDDFDSLGADVHCFATDRVSLGQSRAGLWIADNEPSVWRRRTGRRRTRGQT